MLHFDAKPEINFLESSLTYFYFFLILSVVVSLQVNGIHGASHIFCLHLFIGLMEQHRGTTQDCVVIMMLMHIVQ